jgi:putative iron-dependent peroxidase
MPSNSHVALNIVEDENGEELAIVRGNLPFANAARGEYGTYFIGYARDPAVTEQMLENMFIGRPPGNHDRLLDFSTAVTGTLFFVPSAELLEALADGNPLAAEASAAPAASNGAAGVLAIGSLKGQPQA